MLAVVKLRSGQGERTLREVVLEPSGIRVLASDASAPGLWAGMTD